ncbi:hypothetical protein JCM6882_002090 [Rhodosporidiobolus microsporus]
MNDVPVNGPHNPPQDHGGLQFEEDLGDMPQQLEAARPPPPPAPQPALPAQFPSVLTAPPQPHTSLGPAPGIPVNRAPEQLPALQPMLPDGTPAPPKRPRGRPRKIPGTESRGAGTAAGAPAAPKPRGRPKGSRGRGRGRGRGGRGRGGKRARMSSDEDDFEGDGSETEDEKEDGRGEGSDEEREVDLNREVDDDFGESGRLAATTKFGRKISKPKSFVPTNRPTIHRKKRQATAGAGAGGMALLPVLDANLMCEVCRGGHSPDNNKLVICDACTRGWHQLCHAPTIQPEVVDSPAAWFCRECDAKIAAQRAGEDVTKDRAEGGAWTDGRGEEKKVEGAEAEGEKKAEGVGMEGVEGLNGEAAVAAGENGEKKPEELETNLAKEDEYGEKVKREWLESLPVKTLVGYVLSVEKKFAPLVAPGSSSLPIWPPALPSLLHTAALARAQEAADRERKLELEAEELAAAQGALFAAGGGGEGSTPGPSAPASEVGTPLGFEQIGVEVQGARTAASRRAELQAQQQAAQQAQEQQQQQQAVASSSNAYGQQQQQQGYPAATSSNGHLAQNHPHQHLPPFLRPQVTPVSALHHASTSASASGSPSLSAVGASLSPAGSPAPPVADIPVGGGGARATYGAFPPGYAPQVQGQQPNPYHATAAAAAAALGYGAGAVPGQPQYANQFATGGTGAGADWQAMQRGGSGQGQ